MCAACVYGMSGWQGMGREEGREGRGHVKAAIGRVLSLRGGDSLLHQQHCLRVGLLAFRQLCLLMLIFLIACTSTLHTHPYWQYWANVFCYNCFYVCLVSPLFSLYQSILCALLQLEVCSYLHTYATRPRQRKQYFFFNLQHSDLSYYCSYVNKNT